MNIILSITIVALIVLGPHFLSIYLIQRRERKREKKRNAWWDELEAKETLNRKLSDDPGCENEEVLNPKHWKAFTYHNELN